MAKVVCGNCSGKGEAECPMEYGGRCPSQCPACSGSQKVVCTNCDGSGKVEEY